VGDSESNGFAKLAFCDRARLAIIVLGHEPITPREYSNIQVALSKISKAYDQRAFLGGKVLFHSTSCMLVSLQR